MSVDDPGDGLGRLAGRVFGWFFEQLIVDFLLRGPGYLLVKLFRGANAKRPDPESFQVAVIGLLFWMVLCVLGYFAIALLSFFWWH
jgi:hypothetical protein